MFQVWSDLLKPISTMMGCGHLLSFLEARLGAWFSKKKLKVKVPGWMKVYLRHNLVGSCQWVSIRCKHVARWQQIKARLFWLAENVVLPMKTQQAISGTSAATYKLMEPLLTIVSLTHHCKSRLCSALVNSASELLDQTSGTHGRKSSCQN